LALPPLLKLSEDGMEQVTPVAALQLRLTVPLKPFSEATLIVAVPSLPAATGTIVLDGTSEKSASGFRIGLLSVKAEGL
jgi:hypothetical protein